MPKRLVPREDRDQLEEAELLDLEKQGQELKGVKQKQVLPLLQGRTHHDRKWMG